MQESCHETVMSKPPLRICQVAPLTPLFDDIITWTDLISQYAQDPTAVRDHVAIQRYARKRSTIYHP